MNSNTKKETAEEQNKDAAVKPDPKTLDTPDPQDEMEGPISSLVQGVKEGMEDDKTKEEADKEKNRKM
ncbi:MAG: hypothetical protein LH615_12705 [Ferruginibacter sp.]|nr:hypothetical protein [Ferruginibacter sp.]